MGYGKLKGVRKLSNMEALLERLADMDELESSQTVQEPSEGDFRTTSRIASMNSCTCCAAIRTAKLMSNLGSTKPTSRSYVVGLLYL